MNKIFSSLIYRNSSCSVWILFSGNKGNACEPTPPHHCHLCVIPKIRCVLKLFSINNSSHFKSNRHYFNILLREYDNFIDILNVFRGNKCLILWFLMFLNLFLDNLNELYNISVKMLILNILISKLNLKWTWKILYLSIFSEK